MKKKILIVYASYGSGHKSVAEYVYEYFKEHSNDLEIKIIDIMEYGNLIAKLNVKMFNLCFKFQNSFSSTIGYELFDSKIATSPYKEIVRLLFKSDLTTDILAYKPDVLIATHFFGGIVMGKINKKYKLNTKIITIITDYASHAIWLQNHKRENAIVVSNEIVGRELLKFGVPAEKIFPFGIPLSSKFKKVDANTSKIKFKYNIKNHNLTFLFFGGGSLGSSYTYGYLKEILKLKKEKNTVILAHSYQAKEIIEIADETGDSYALSVAATKHDCSSFIMCGVHFMAETVKMLSPDKKVYLANTEAGCPMAEQMDPVMISQLKAKEPDRAVVAYINTTAALKAVCDVCVTSATAVKIVSKMKNNKILFIPDCNLGSYVKKQVPDKDIKLLQGGCPVHAAVTLSELKAAKKKHPEALILVHPECRPEITESADYVGSTSGIMSYAIKSSAKEFIIGTEMSITEHLQYACPDKNFYYLSKKIICPNMKLTTLMDVYNTLKSIGYDNAQEIVMSDDEIKKSRICIDEMIRLGE